MKEHCDVAQGPPIDGHCSFGHSHFLIFQLLEHVEEYWDTSDGIPPAREFYSTTQIPLHLTPIASIKATP